ncbi:hypothetical protein [Vibrio parahaemolyticus]|uniref:hypothetical protein n=1 Tax=Vibrio parahaemolyticus TaxID=670 RepID=UPI001C5D2F84|nr:hypothetical protein [Vibrio parahaemolyticus]
MGFINKEVIRGITGVSDEEQASIKAFLQGAVYCWCKNRRNEWFSLRDLMGEFLLARDTTNFPLRKTRS